MRSALIILVLASSFASAGNQSPSNPLIGKWYFLDKPDGCRDTYHFRDDGTFSSTSGLEAIEGRYKLQSPTPDTNGRYAVTRTIEKDRGAEDCVGSTSVQTGKTDTRYIYFDSTEEQLMVCSSPTSTDCFGPLLRAHQ